MAILSVKYPIIYTGPAAGFDYSISLDGNVIYTAHSYNSTVDLSRVFQSYMNSSLVNITDEDLPDIASNSVVKEFTVSGGTSTVTYMVANDYNDDYVTEYDETYITSDSVTGKYHPNGLLFVDVNSPGANANIRIGDYEFQSGYSSQIQVNVENKDDEDIIEVTPSHTSTNYTINSVNYFNGYIFVFCNTGYSYYSTDGINWIANRLGTSTLRDSCTSANYIAVVDSTHSVRYSQNGTTWSIVTIPGSSSQFETIEYGNGLFVVMRNDEVAYSPDLINWTSRTYLETDLIAPRQILYAQNMFVAVGFSNPAISYDGPALSYSTDGINWTYGTVNSSQVLYFNGVAYGQGKFIAGGATGYIASSNDGMNWTLSSIGVSNTQINCMAYGGGVFFAGQNDGEFVYSEDGITWKSGSTGESDYPINDAFFHDGKFYCGSTLGRTYVIEIIRSTVIDSIYVNDTLISINYSSGCERYSIYWVNKLGGRSQLLLHAKSRELTSNSFTRIRTNYNRVDPSSFENVTILNDTNKRWILYTEILDDEQSEKMIDLITSPKVWLHDHEKNMIFSVVITDSEKEKLTRQNNRMFSYTINVSQAQNHLRK